MSEKEKIVDELLTRRVEGEMAYPSKEVVRERLLGATPLVVYWGIDPTAPEIHLGHTIALLFLKQLKALGHRPVVLIGDFTARIGDPTDKAAARRSLTKEEVEGNMGHYIDQITKILPRGSFEIRRNSEWLAPMTLENVIGLASSATVQQMLARDMFQERMKQEKPIFIHELLYPLMQGYDSVAMNVDGEVGGSDQTFNMLVGRTLMKQLSGKEKIVFSLRLFADAADGKKMGKSEGNLIAISDEPQEIRRKILMLDDKVVATAFELCTEKDLDWIGEHAQGDPRQFKEELAEELVRMYHGQGAVERATQDKEMAIRGQSLDKGLVTAGVAPTMSAAHQLIDQGGVEIDGQKIKEWKYVLKEGERLKVGKGKFLKVS
ncbi:MAG: tyrosine--tRNA ligase [Patescibacteria group bacterium]